MKILIADDELVVRNSLTAILKGSGEYETDFAQDGEDALQKFMEGKFDAVLLDIEMPKLDGYEVLKQIRMIDPTMPVVFITGKGKPGKVAQSIYLDKLNAFIEKPFTTESVLEVVKNVLTKRG